MEKWPRGYGSAQDLVPVVQPAMRLASSRLSASLPEAMKRYKSTDSTVANVRVLLSRGHTTPICPMRLQRNVAPSPLGPPLGKVESSDTP